MAQKEKIKAAPSETISSLTKKIKLLTERIEALEARAGTKVAPAGMSINKVEGYNGELEPAVRPTSGLQMSHADKIHSARNAVKILNPKLIVDGRHLPSNVAAICGFPVDEGFLDEVYAGLKGN